MLPSTGLFKSFSCPYYNDTTTPCTRPYCHFKHVKNEQTEEQTAAAVPEYKPAPKLLALPTPALSKKKHKLEYQPEKPELNASPSKKRSTDAAPVYIPAPTAAASGSAHNAALLNLDDCEEELEELSGIINDQVMEEDDENSKENKSTLVLIEEKTIASKEPEEKLERQIKTEKEKKNIKTELDYKEKVPKTERRDSSASSGSSSKHKHTSNSKSKDNCSETRENKSSKNRTEKHEKKKEDENQRRRHKEIDKDKKSGSSNSSNSTNSKHKSSTSTSSSSSKRSDRDKQRSSSSSTNNKVKQGSLSSTSTSTSTTKKYSSHKSSSSSKHNSSSSTVTSKVKTNAAARSIKPSSDKLELDTDTAALFATTEDDIMKECEMIYDQLEQEFASLHKDEQKEESSQASKRKLSEDNEDKVETSGATQKKRVAYENADKHKSHQPVVPRKPNHVRNAMQAIYERQSVIRRKQEEEKAAAEVALREAEEKVREANEALRKAKEKSLTPLIPKSYLTPPTRPISRSIAPVANILALERAKKKVEALRAEKKPAFTPAQTKKIGGRVAHKITTPLTAEEPKKQAAPPVLEANATKISFNIRMQYYEMMVKHCIAIYPNIADAWERGQTEELAVFKKCNTPVIYKSSSMLAINKLRKEATESGNKPTANKIISHEVILAGKLATNTSWSVQKKMKTVATTGGEPFDKLPGDKAYDMVYELRLSEEQLVSNGYPRPGKRAGSAIVTNVRPMRRPNETERYCSRCGKVFNTDIYDEVCVDECNYHPKSTGYRRGYADNLHRCCQQPASTAGCTYANYHVTDYVDVGNLTGYVTTIDKSDDYVSTKKDIYALDCEMCYTTHGIELTRVTVVDINSRTVYDALVKPDNKIVDYNTIYSGITEQMLANETRTLRDVQAILMSMFHSKTVLIGHSLDSDLKALKLIHSVVLDTSVLFPHKMGPPKKRALKTLCIENLKRIIQENEAGHDSAEDAEVCIQLVKFYLRNKIS